MELSSADVNTESGAAVPHRCRLSHAASRWRQDQPALSANQLSSDISPAEWNGAVPPCIHTDRALHFPLATYPTPRPQQLSHPAIHPSRSAYIRARWASVLKRRSCGCGHPRGLFSVWIHSGCFLPSPRPPSVRPSGRMHNKKER